MNIVARRICECALFLLGLGVLGSLGCGGGRPDPAEKPEQRPAVPAPSVPLPLSALAAGGRHAGTLPAGQTRMYVFPLQADQYLHLIVEQLGLDVAATIRDPAGQRLLHVDSMNGDKGPEDLFWVVETTGRHVLEIAASEGAGGGRYEIRVDAFRMAAEEDRTRAAAAGFFSRGWLLEVGKSGDRAAAAVSYGEAARLWGLLGDESREAWALYLQGRIEGEDPARRRGAVKILSRAVELFERVGEERQQALALHHLGLAWQKMDEIDRASECYERALAFWQKEGDPGELATRLNDLAILRVRQGRTNLAIDLYSQAIGVWEEKGMWKELAATRTNLGLLYVSLGESRMALDQYRRALALLDQQPDRRKRAVTLNKMGDVLLGLEGPESAMKWYRQALELRRQEHDARGEAVTLNSIGLAWLQANRPREALQAFTAAAEIFLRIPGEELAQAVVLNNLGLAYERLGHQDRALENYRRALGQARESGHSPEQAASLFGLARMVRMEGRLDEAEELMKESLGIVERLRAQVWRPDLRASFHATKQDHYAFLIDLLAERHQRQPEAGHDDRAFSISERARARSLLDLLTVASARPSAEDVRGLEAMSRRVNARHLDLLASSARGIASGALEEELTGLLESLRQAKADVEGPRLPRSDVSSTLALPQVQRHLLDEDTVLLEYFLGEKRSFLWAVTSTARRFVMTLPGREQIENAARQTYERMIESHHQTGEIAAGQAAEKLSRMILGPVADLLDRQRIVVVASGALQVVPFTALPHPGRKGREPRPLIVDHEIVSLPSASVLAVLRSKNAGRRPPEGFLAIVADPVLEPWDERVRKLVRPISSQPGAAPGLRRLQYAGREADVIAALAGSRPLLSASGFQASRKLVESGRLSGYRILHFATHSQINDRLPALSALALSSFDAAGRPVDGQFRAYEISGLDLRADLVVLGACRTAVGPEVNGEGLKGMTQAFLHAGVPRLVASLWDVDDRATEELMKRFYAGLVRDKLSPAKALRQAQMSLRGEARWRDPYYWAGFVLQGDWQ